ncbi:MAG: hypothetical protein IKX26_00375 [Bacteroidales bacterium]|nr:hypothetical protein [Bacteroidales bacterium]
MKKIYPLLLDGITPESTALKGFLKDNSLEDLIDTYMGNLLGDKVFSYFQGNLPITVKLCDEPGNITVSPDDETALPRYGNWGKERMLYILSAKEDSSIWIGFKKDLTATDIYERSISGTILETMNEIGPEEGETFYIRPGVPFRVGEGVRYVEVAQNSPCDFNIGETDQLVEALDFINLNASNPEYVAPEECLFRMERVAITKPQTIAPDQTESFMAIFNLDNQTSLKVKDLRGYTEISDETCITLDSIHSNTSNHLAAGPISLVLIPHDIQELTISPSQDGDNPSSSFLRIYMCNIPEPPKEEEEEEEEHHHHDCDDEDCH